MKKDSRKEVISSDPRLSAAFMCAVLGLKLSLFQRPCDVSDKILALFVSIGEFLVFFFEDEQVDKKLVEEFIRECHKLNSKLEEKIDAF